jgi:predicted enzyme related to lactoylglutathione lyase
MANPVVYFEVGAAENQPLAEFYGQLFGWEMRSVAPGYTLIDTRGGGGVGGGVGRSGTGEPWSTFYVEVDDLPATLARVGSMGGRTVAEPMEIPGMGSFAMFDDPDGVLVGLTGRDRPAGGMWREPSGGDGVPVDWFEVLGADAGRAQAFYRELFGWTVGQGAYGQVDTGGGIAGGIGAGGDERWATVYAAVADTEAALARAESLGGTRVYGPKPVDDHTDTGAFRDPAGNVFGVYRHGPH